MGTEERSATRVGGFQEGLRIGPVLSGWSKGSRARHKGVERSVTDCVFNAPSTNRQSTTSNDMMSLVGTNRTWCDVRSESAFGGKAEVWLKGRQVRWDPQRTWTPFSATPSSAMIPCPEPRGGNETARQSRRQSSKNATPQN